MKIFFSYSNKDKNLANEIKDHIKRNGFECFMAHDDIEISEEWMDRIRKELFECDIFIPILTKNFIESYWTNQEVGFALAFNNKLIFIIKINEVPNGFINKYQAFTYNSNKKTLLENFYKVLYNSEQYSLKYKSEILNNLKKSDSYLESNEQAKKIALFKQLSIDDLNKIIKYSMQNDQIYKSTRAIKIIRNIITKNRDLINANSYNKFINYLRN